MPGFLQTVGPIFTSDYKTVTLDDIKHNLYNGTVSMT